MQDSESYKRWLDVDVPIYMKIWLFNVTNAENVTNGDSHVILNEIGPFVFAERKTKHITFSDNDSIAYQPINSYEFLPAESGNLTLDQKVTYVNIPYFAVVKKFRELKKSLPWWIYNPTVKVVAAAAAEAKEKPFEVRTARELLFEGYEEPLLKQFKKYHVPIPDILPNNTFGLFYGKNGRAADGEYVINRGISDLSKLTEIMEWNGKRYERCKLTRLILSFMSAATSRFGRMIHVMQSTERMERSSHPMLDEVLICIYSTLICAGNE